MRRTNRLLWGETKSVEIYLYQDWEGKLDWNVGAESQELGQCETYLGGIQSQIEMGGPLCPRGPHPGGSIKKKGLVKATDGWGAGGTLQGQRKVLPDKSVYKSKKRGSRLGYHIKFKGRVGDGKTRVVDFSTGGSVKTHEHKTYRRVTSINKAVKASWRGTTNGENGTTPLRGP